MNTTLSASAAAAHLLIARQTAVMARERADRNRRSATWSSVIRCSEFTRLVEVGPARRSLGERWFRCADHIPAAHHEARSGRGPRLRSPSGRGHLGGEPYLARYSSQFHGGCPSPPSRNRTAASRPFWYSSCWVASSRS